MSDTTSTFPPIDPGRTEPGRPDAIRPERGVLFGPGAEVGAGPTGPSSRPLSFPPPPGARPPGKGAEGAKPAGGARSVLVAAVVAAVVSAGVTVPLTRALDDGAAPVATADAPDDATEEVVAAVDEGEAIAPPAGGDIADVAEAVLPTVARVDVVGAMGNGSGSAVIFRSDGYLLTNNHVVEEAARVRVTLPDATPREAEVIGTDPSSDLAVLKVDATDLPVLRFADRAPRVGETVIAVGSPFGLDGSVTSGIVSANNRSVPTPGAPLVDMIQTDAAINPGNSGGALVDAQGRLVGINTAILSRSGANDGIGFAIPITTALSVAEQLVETGEVQHAQLGVQGQDVDPAVAELYGLGVRNGAVVVAVEPGSGADRAGLQPGDIITAVDGQPVSSMLELAGRIRTQSPGDTVTLTFTRAGAEREVEVTLGSARPREQR